MIAKNLPVITLAFLDLIDSLSKRDLKILRMRFIQHKTLQEVGDAFGITNSAIKELEDKAIKKIELAFDYLNLK
jgi:RNA polymerase sigma factor (sigma-70 family)